MANYTSSYTGAQIDAAIGEVANKAEQVALTNLQNLSLPAINGISLNNTSLAFSASDLGITFFEDCQVIKGHDGKYYMFLDDYSGYDNNDIYCVSSDSPLFTNYTVVGRVIERALSRVGGVVYDKNNEEYILYVVDDDSPNDGVYAYSISQADFPDGTWVNEGLVLPLGASGEYDGYIINAMGNILKTADTYIMPYSSYSTALSTIIWWNLAYSKDPKGTFIKSTKNPILQEKISLTEYNPPFKNTRAIISLSNGYLCFFEEQNDAKTQWQIGAYFLDQSFMFKSDVQGSLFFAAANRGFVNANSYYIDITNKTLYLYYQATIADTPANDFCQQYVATFDIY